MWFSEIHQLSFILITLLHTVGFFPRLYKDVAFREEK